jgi:tetratricopeptide (TPR) repeat protein
MKKSILILAGLGVAAVLAFHYATRPGNSPTPTTVAPVAADQTPAGAAPSPAPSAPKAVVATTTAAPTAAQPAASAAQPAASAAAHTSEENVAFAAAIDTLLSPHSTYLEKQAAWKSLLDSGRIQDVLAELQQRAANDPQNAEVASTLGQAYLKACGTTQDVREQAIWAMQADQEFDAALSDDPSNWEARFTKAVAMTYWPANLNKGPEIVSQFNTLIQQQEQQPPQPQFALAYDYLGQQYEKAGQPDLAQQVWQRGASLFPNNPTLQGRLAPPAQQ